MKLAARWCRSQTSNTSEGHGSAARGAAWANEEGKPVKQAEVAVGARGTETGPSAGLVNTQGRSGLDRRLVLISKQFNRWDS